MPKTKISEFSSTPASNTDIDSINIAEGCAPSGINDAIRELMAQLKDFQTGAVGDSFNGPVGTTTAAAGAFTTLAASGAVTLSGGTANGVTYLNGSKVVTSGSALTFSGTNLGVSGNGAFNTGASGGVISGTSTYSGYFSALGGGSGAIISITPDTVSGANGATYNTSFVSGGSGPHVFQIGGTEQMRLTTTGLGIGTTSPTQTVSVGLTSGTKGFNIVYQPSSAELAVFTANAATGEVRIGGTGGTYFPTFYSNGLESARIDSSGNLLVGTTSSTNKFHVKGTSAANMTCRLEPYTNSYASKLLMSSQSSGDGGIQYGASAGNNLDVFAYDHIIFSNGSISGSIGTERARIDSSGNLLRGQTASGVLNNRGFYSDVSGYFGQNHLSGDASGSVYAYFAYNGSSIGTITQSGTTAVLYNVTSDQRLKENIVNAPEFGNVIDSIKVRSFDWKTDNTHQRAGFIAQELVTVAPEAVHQPEDTDEMMAVDYSKLVPMLVKEIQSLRKRLADAGI